MEHTEETDISPKEFWVGGNFHQGRGADFEEKIVNDLLVLQGQRSEFVRQREHDVRVRYRRQIS